MRRTRPSVILRVDYHTPIEKTQLIKTDDNNYHGGVLQDEMAALIALCLGIRLKSGGETRSFDIEGDPKGRPYSFSFIPDPVVPLAHKRPILPSIIGTHSLDSALLISKLPTLSVKDAVALIRAARLYEEAVWISDTSPEMSWLLLTSAVETIANRWKEVKETPLEQLRNSRPKLEQILQEKGDEEFVKKVADEIAPYMGATKKFTDFIVKFLPSEPQQRPVPFMQFTWTESNIRKALKKIYNYRSQALHGGKPFPAPMCQAPMTVGDSDIFAEVPLGLATSSRGSTWIAKDTPILLHMFEYIVRHSILNWWEATTEEEKLRGE
jgi:hypothetical protein